MDNNLEEKLRCALSGWDIEYILPIINKLRDECNAKIHKDVFPDLNPCPVCGKQKGYVVARFPYGVFAAGKEEAFYCRCPVCGYQSKLVNKDYYAVSTPAFLRAEAIRAWNASKVVPFFELMETMFGKEYQYACNQEEIHELMEALIRYGKLSARTQRADREVIQSDLVSEMADVIICIYQVMHSRNIPHHELQIEISKKIKRTCLPESVRSAILKLSKRITKATTINVPTVDES